MGYREICHASLVFTVYTRVFRWVCIRRKYKWQVACSTASHEKALHNHANIIGKFTEIFGKVRKYPGFPLQNRFWVYLIMEDFRIMELIMELFELFFKIVSLKRALSRLCTQKQKKYTSIYLPNLKFKFLKPWQTPLTSWNVEFSSLQFYICKKNKG